MREAHENAEDTAAVSAIVDFLAKAQSSSSARTIETGKMELEGKGMKMILVNFSESQEDHTLKSSSATIAFCLLHSNFFFTYFALF